MNSSLHRVVGLFLVASLGACADPSPSPADASSDTPSDAGDVPVVADAADTPAPGDVTDVTDVTGDASDVADVVVDARPYDAGSYACGSMTCAADQVCVHPCSGVNSGMGGPPPVCVHVPDECGATPTCDCVHPAACPGSSGGGFPACRQSGARDLICQLCA